MKPELSPSKMRVAVPVLVKRGVVAGRETLATTRFGVGLMNQERTMRTKQLASRLRNGRLAAECPDHPLLVILAAYHNREMLLECANQGARIRLARSPESLIHRYVPGDSGLPGTTPGQAVLRTGDLKLAAALATIGCRALLIAGERHRRIFTLEVAVPELPGGLGRADAAELTVAWRSDPESVPWQHPFAQAMRGLHNRERLLDCVNRSAVKVTLQQPGGGRFAVVSADAAGNLPARAMDAVGKFFRR